MRRLWSTGIVVVSLAALATSCGRPPKARQYALRGQIIGIDAGKAELLVKHEDIKGFMPGMTMPFEVDERRLMDGLEPGDLIAAKLIVTEDEARLTSIEKTGSAPLDTLPPAPAARSGFELLKPGEEVPDARFVDQSGGERRLAAFRGHAVALTFIYTRCPVPTFCPFMDRQFGAVQRSLKRRPELGGRVRLLSISFDPANDRPPVLEAHARSLRADQRIWSFLTGDRDEIDRFAARFGVTVIREENARDITHNLRTAIIDPAGKLVKVYSGIDWTPEQVVSDLAQAAH